VGESNYGRRGTRKDCRTVPGRRLKKKKDQSKEAKGTEKKTALVDAQAERRSGKSPVGGRSGKNVKVKDRGQGR